MITLPGLRFVQALLFTQASTAFTYIAPGGGIVGMAGSYGLLRAWGFESGPVARAVALTGVWNQLANLLFPVAAVLLLSIEEQQDAVLTTAAVVGGIVFAVAVGVLVLVFWSEQLAREIGRVAATVPSTGSSGRSAAAPSKAGRTGSPSSAPRRSGSCAPLVAADDCDDRRQPGGLRDPAHLPARGRHRGERDHVDRGVRGWSLARVLQLIPLTPGGIGPVELGLTGILVGLGGPNAEVVAAVLLYRAFTILPTLLLGSATIVGWRWLRPAPSRKESRRPR